MDAGYRSIVDLNMIKTTEPRAVILKAERFKEEKPQPLTLNIQYDSRTLNGSNLKSLGASGGHALTTSNANTIQSRNNLGLS